MPEKQDFSESELQLLRQLGTAIRSVRKQRGLSQEALADAAGVDRSHMGRIERGNRNVTTLKLLQVAAALKISAEDIFALAKL